MYYKRKSVHNFVQAVNEIRTAMFIFTFFVANICLHLRIRHNALIKAEVNLSTSEI